jgi:hypothetical protein
LHDERRSLRREPLAPDAIHQRTAPLPALLEGVYELHYGQRSVSLQLLSRGPSGEVPDAGTGDVCTVLQLAA